MTNELFDIVDDNHQIIGQAPRTECHGNPNLVHRAVHVVIFHTQNDEILLQKRSIYKDIQPGRWDTAVGGHLNLGEDYLTAAYREMEEELGICDKNNLIHLFDSKIRNATESENIRTFAYFYNGPFVLQESEVEEVRFFTRAELLDIIENDNPDFTPNLKDELLKILTNRRTQIA